MNNKINWIGIVGGALMVLGTFLPYFSIFFIQINLWGNAQSAFGVDLDLADGLLPRALFFTGSGLLIPILYLFAARPAKVIGLILSLAACAFVTVDYVNYMQITGTGIIVIALGTVVATVAGILELRRSNQKDNPGAYRFGKNDDLI